MLTIIYFFASFFFYDSTPFPTSSIKEIECNSEWGWCDLLKNISSECLEAEKVYRGNVSLCIENSKSNIILYDYFPTSGKVYYIWYEADHFSLWRKNMRHTKPTLEQVLKCSYIIPSELTAYIILYIKNKEEASAFYIYANPHISLKSFQDFFNSHMKHIGNYSYVYGPMNINAYKTPQHMMLYDFIPPSPDE